MGKAEPQAHEHFVVRAGVERGVGPQTDFLQRGAANKGRLSRNDLLDAEDAGKVVGRPTELASDDAVLVHEVEVAVDDPQAGIPLHLLHRPARGPRQQLVVGVQDEEDISASAPECPTQGLGLPAIGLGHPPHISRGPTQEVNTPVSGVPILDHVLDVRISLRVDARQADDRNRALFRQGVTIDTTGALM
jgi:hypothetical protein